MDSKILILKKTKQTNIYSKSEHERIEKNWLKINKKRRNIFNGKLLNFQSSEKTISGEIFTVANNISYKEIVGLRYLDGIKNQKVKKSEQNLRVISCAIKVETSDRKKFFIERNAGDLAKALDVPGGFIQLKHLKDGKLGVEDFVTRRLQVDLGVKKSEIGQVIFEKINIDRKILEYMFVYRVVLKISLKDLKNKKRNKIYELPTGYTLNNHKKFFRLNAHPPLKNIL